MTTRFTTRDRLAAELALGIGSAADRARATELAETDSTFRRLVEAWQMHLAGLAECGPDLPPPPGTLAAIKRRIAIRQAAAAIDPATEGAAARPGWRSRAAGVSCRSLASHPGVPGRLWLLRFEAGAELPPHPHPVTETCVVLEGSVVSNGTLLQAGDLQAIEAGTAHQPVTSPMGALVVVHVATNRDGGSR